MIPKTLLMLVTCALLSALCGSTASARPALTDTDGFGRLVPALGTAHPFGVSASWGISGASTSTGDDDETVGEAPPNPGYDGDDSLSGDVSDGAGSDGSGSLGG